MTEAPLPPDATGSAPDPGESPRLDVSAVRRLATEGVGLVAVRGSVLRVVGFASTLLLARLLVPADFGAVAIGSTIITIAEFLGDGGIGAALVRRPEEPDRADLGALLAFAVAVAVVITAAVVAIALPLGHVGAVTAVMVLGLPVVALRSPGSVMFERNLQFRPLVAIEVGEWLAYYAWAVGTVLLGWGVWGLATAVLARAVVGTAVILVRSPVGWVRPQFSMQRIRGMLKFGLQYSATSVVSLIREQVINFAILGIAGTALLGIWNLANSILQAPFLLFESLWRVSMPAWSRLASTDEPVAPILKDSVAVAAAATGVTLTALIGAGPHLAPILFGSKWNHVSEILPFACFGLLIAGPISVASSGYLYAQGRADTVLRAFAADAIANNITAIPLLPFLGATAVGIGTMMGSLAESTVMALGVRRMTGVDLWREMAVPAAAATVASAIGWSVGSSLPPNLFIAAGLGAGAAALYLGALFVIRRPLVYATSRVVRTTLLAAVRK